MEMGKSNRRPMWEYKMREEIIMKRSDYTRHPDSRKTLTNIMVACNYMDKSMMKRS
ncbi:hypothetical protein E2C01_044102 [Portunus trituberculatus]|uniref:Uncharacterized protein n=1 Tax=Portunus trituberculatus TaxID=210409 RepID=A0A5B7FYH7_PORTR|nr:hypothetical protein [Portunus trituberculatus]